MAGPLVRSSYRAGRLWAQAMRRRGEDLPPEPGPPGRGRDGPAGGRRPARRLRRLRPTPAVSAYPAGMARTDQQGRRGDKPPGQEARPARPAPADLHRHAPGGPQLPWWMLGALRRHAARRLVVGVLRGHRLYLASSACRSAVMVALVIMVAPGRAQRLPADRGQPGVAGAVAEEHPRAAGTSRTSRSPSTRAPATWSSARGPAAAWLLVAEGRRRGSSRLVEGERKRIARVAGAERAGHRLHVGRRRGPGAAAPAQRQAHEDAARPSPRPRSAGQPPAAGARRRPARRSRRASTPPGCGPDRKGVRGR